MVKPLLLLFCIIFPISFLSAQSSIVLADSARSSDERFDISLLMTRNGFEGPLTAFEQKEIKMVRVSLFWQTDSMNRPLVHVAIPGQMVIIWPTLAWIMPSLPLIAAQETVSSSNLTPFGRCKRDQGNRAGWLLT